MRVVTRVRIGKEKIFMGRGVKELLEAIELYGSIKKATEITTISYSKAMKMIRILNDELGFDVVASEKGGSNHGKTVLTEKGRRVLECYQEIEGEVEAFAKKIVDERFCF